MLAAPVLLSTVLLPTAACGCHALQQYAPAAHPVTHVPLPRRPPAPVMMRAGVGSDRRQPHLPVLPRASRNRWADCSRAALALLAVRRCLPRVLLC